VKLLEICEITDNLEAVLNLPEIQYVSRNFEEKVENILKL